MAFCSQCGAKLPDGAKFCHMCGAAVAGGASKNSSQRQQEYIGKVLKCPNCGATITETTAVCPECGIHITGKEAVSSVRLFQQQLMAIEMSRKRRKVWEEKYSDPVDSQKLELIKSFPIPNTVDDIQEFVLLAVANIDVDRSKRKRWYESPDRTIEKKISDAWVSKMQQAYQKASVSFPDDPAFANVERIYLEKMKELDLEP